MMQNKLFIKRIVFLVIALLFCVSTVATAEFIEYSMNSSVVNIQSSNVQDFVQQDANQTVLNSNESKKEVLYVNTPNFTNSSVKFMYYIPQTLVNSKKPYPVIVFVPGLDGDGETSVNGEFYDLADSYGFAILTPTFKFNMDDFNQERSYQYPKAWAADALVDMLNKAKSRGLNYSKLYLVGFSAGAQFSSRFSLLKPELVDACAIMASGARVIPKQRNDVKYFVGIGTSDTEYRRENALLFTNNANKLGMSVEYHEYAIGHDMNEQEINDVVEFFKKVKNSNY